LCHCFSCLATCFSAWFKETLFPLFLSGASAPIPPKRGREDWGLKPRNENGMRSAVIHALKRVAIQLKRVAVHCKQSVFIVSPPPAGRAGRSGSERRGSICRSRPPPRRVEPSAGHV